MSGSPITFGHTSDGQEVFQYILRSSPDGIEARVITYGAALQSLLHPNKSGDRADVVLGYDTVAGYEANPPYIGVVIGRVAGRISGGCFTIDGVQHNVTRNHDNGSMTIHGGDHGISRRNWNVVKHSSDSVTLGIVSEDGDEGFPGCLEVQVTYTVTTNDLTLNYSATCDKPCPVNLTNHSYFNLAGAGSQEVFDHVAMVDARQAAELDASLLPTGDLKDMSGDEHSLQKPRLLGDKIPKTPDTGYEVAFDYFYPFEEESVGDVSRVRARVEHPGSGRSIELFTNQRGVQFYTSYFLDGLNGKGGKKYNKYTAFCLEAQGYPDGMNKPELKQDLILRPGEPYTQITIYKFGGF